jgi:hypothetical protein
MTYGKESLADHRAGTDRESDPDGFPWETAWNPGFPLREDGTVKLPS